MSYRTIPLSDMLVNRANDRHGELENETAAIGWLFSNHLGQMKKLAEDIVGSKGLYEPPLVYQGGSHFVVYDGNRRTTCLKLLADPKRAPNAELRDFFVTLRTEWTGAFTDRIMCRVETDRDGIDEILYRRHTGSQGGVVQSTWDDRQKATFVNPTGKGGKLNVADEIETRLTDAGLLPKECLGALAKDHCLSRTANRRVLHRPLLVAPGADQRPRVASGNFCQSRNPG